MKTGIVFGAFDLLHAGHIHLLEQCNAHCDNLIVGLHIDPSVERKEKNKPIESVLEREIKLASVKYVYRVIPYEKESDIKTILTFFKINVRFLGSDYAKESAQPNQITAESIVPIVYIDSLPIHTSDIRERIKNGN